MEEEDKCHLKMKNKRGNRVHCSILLKIAENDPTIGSPENTWNMIYILSTPYQKHLEQTFNIYNLLSLKVLGNSNVYFDVIF